MNSYAVLTKEQLRFLVRQQLARRKQEFNVPRTVKKSWTHIGPSVVDAVVSRCPGGSHYWCLMRKKRVRKHANEIPSSLLAKWREANAEFQR